MTPHRPSRFAAWQRWARHTFTREKVLDNLKLFLWVAPLTVLIWVYAEREQSNSDYPVDDVTIKLVNNDPSRFVAFAGATDQRVNLTLSGPQSNLENVEKELAAYGISIDLGNALGPGNGQRSVNVVNRIQDDPRLREAGVSVVSSQPTELAINVDAMRSEQLYVKVPPTVTNLDMSKTHFDPKQVLISGPESAFKEAKSLAVYAALIGSPALNTPGAQDVSDVPLKMDLAEGSQISISPSTVKAHLEVLSSDITREIASVPIVVTAPPKVLQAYYVDVQPASIANVWITGPPDQVQNATVEAELRVTNDDIGGSDLPRQLKYDLPDGVRLSPDHQEALQPVKFTLVQRTSGG